MAKSLKEKAERKRERREANEVCKWLNMCLRLFSSYSINERREREK